MENIGKIFYNGKMVPGSWVDYG